MRKTTVLLLCGVLMCLCGCRRSRFKGVEFEPYKPPTLVATVVNTPTVNPITPMPTSVNNYTCTPNLSFVDDVTVPDGTTFVPGDQIEKTWAVRNDGDCTWNDKFSLRYIDGSALGAENHQELPPLEPGETGEITVTFYAPQSAGSYWTGWQAYDPQGEPFGDDIYMEIIVDPYYTKDETQDNAYEQQQYGYGYW